MSTCSYPEISWIPLTQTCTKYGECNEELGICECIPGFSSQADFINAESYECPTNHAALQILYAILLGVTLMCFVYSLPVVIARFQNFLELRATMKGYNLWVNKGLLAVVIQFLIVLPLMMVVSAWKIYSPQSSLGFDKFLTSLFFLVRSGFYLSAAIYQPALISSLLGRLQDANHLVHHYIRSFVLVEIIALIPGMLPFVTLFWFQDDLDSQLKIIFTVYIVQGFQLFAQSIIGWVMVAKVTKVLNFSIKVQANDRSKDKTKLLKKNLIKMQRTVITQGFVIGVCNFTFFAIPYLWTKHAYFMAIYWLIIPVVCLQCAHAVNLDTYRTRNLVKFLEGRYKKFAGYARESSSLSHPSSVIDLPLEESAPSSKPKMSRKSSLLVFGGSLSNITTPGISPRMTVTVMELKEKGDIGLVQERELKPIVL